MGLGRVTVPFESARRLFLLVTPLTAAVLAAVVSAQWTAILTGLAGSLLRYPAICIEFVKAAHDRVADAEPRSPGLRAQLTAALDRQVTGSNLRGTLCLFAGAALLAASFVAQMVGALS